VGGREEGGGQEKDGGEEGGGQERDGGAEEMEFEAVGRRKSKGQGRGVGERSHAGAAPYRPHPHIPFHLPYTLLSQRPPSIYRPPHLDFTPPPSTTSLTHLHHLPPRTSICARHCLPSVRKSSSSEA
jgi:hypothetical protein